MLCCGISLSLSDHYRIISLPSDPPKDVEQALGRLSTDDPETESYPEEKNRALWKMPKTTVENNPVQPLANLFHPFVNPNGDQFQLHCSKDVFGTFVSRETEEFSHAFFELKKSGLRQALTDAAVVHERRSVSWEEDIERIVDGNYEEITVLSDCCLRLFQRQRNHHNDLLNPTEKMLNLHDLVVQRLTEEVCKRTDQPGAWQSGDDPDP